MKELTIQLNEKQEKFLKVFAEKQSDEADDNLFTASPIHVVENKRYRYIPYSEDIVDWFGSLPLVFTSDSGYEYWYEDEMELIKDWYEDEDEGCPIEIKPFEFAMSLTDIEGVERLITEYTEYFEAYGIKIYGISWREAYWEPEAFFFIRDEAKRYIEYQRHNLSSPRVYTYSPGYANYGDFVPFRDLLMSIGTQLNKETE